MVHLRGSCQTFRGTTPFVLAWESPVLTKSVSSAWCKPLGYETSGRGVILLWQQITERPEHARVWCQRQKSLTLVNKLQTNAAAGKYWIWPSRQALRHVKWTHYCLAIWWTDFQQIQEKLQIFSFDFLIWLAVNRWEVRSEIVTCPSTSLGCERNTLCRPICECKEKKHLLAEDKRKWGDRGGHWGHWLGYVDST